jgi:hypothetical protein
MEPVWLVKIQIPKKLMHDINRGYKALDRNKVEDVLTQNNITGQITEPADQAAAAAGVPAQ